MDMWASLIPVYCFCWIFITMVSNFVSTEALFKRGTLLLINVYKETILTQLGKFIGGK